MEKLIAKIERIFPQLSFELTQSCNDLTIEISANSILKIGGNLCNNEELGFTQLIDLFAIDYLDYKTKPRERFAVVYNLLSLQHNCRLRVRASIADSVTPEIESVIKIWPNAAWYEREVWEMFGIEFAGHKNLQRLLTNEETKGYPLRKNSDVA